MIFNENPYTAEIVLGLCAYQIAFTEAEDFWGSQNDENPIIVIKEMLPTFNFKIFNTKEAFELASGGLCGGSVVI